MLALGMNTYTAYRVVPFFFAAYFAYWLITHRQRICRDLEGMVVFAAGAAVAVAPLGVYTIRNWNVFISRINHISIFPGCRGRRFLRAAVVEPAQDAVHVQLAGRQRRPEQPAGRAAVAGHRGRAVRAGHHLGDSLVLERIPFLYLVWFGAVASLAVLSVAHEAPTARRPIGLLPVIYLLVGSGLRPNLAGVGAMPGAQKRWRPLAVALGGAGRLRRC